MKCEILNCDRDGLSQRELDIHMKYYHGVIAVSKEQPQKIVGGVCPDCGSTLWFQEGCANCQACGFSRCG